MEMSYCQELDVQGMQPHAREYLEHRVLREQSDRKGRKIPGVMLTEMQYDDHVHEDGFGHWRDKAPVSREGEQFGPKP